MRNKCVWVLLVVCLLFVGTGCGKKQAPAAEVKKGQEVVSAPVPQPSSAPITEERTLFSFETGYEGFEIPNWVEENPGNASVSAGLSKSFASEGSQSICLNADFPGKIWTAAIIELEQFLDLRGYRQIAVDIYVPKNAPLGLKAKIILTIGENWQWTEMVRSVALSPGEWVTVDANIEDGSFDWKRSEVTDAFRGDIRKIVVRIESNKTPIYNGPIYIDHIRVGR